MTCVLLKECYKKDDVVLPKIYRSVPVDWIMVLQIENGCGGGIERGEKYEVGRRCC